MRSQCVCGDCAEEFGHISAVPSDCEEVWIITLLTKKLEDAGYCEGEECEFSHDHASSKSCEQQYKCECGDLHDTRSDAEECCEAWECNFCGSIHRSGGGWWGGNGKDSAAECCAYSCDDCGAYGWPDWIEEHTCNTGMGMRQMLPWEARGIKVDGTKPDAGSEWKDVWGFEPADEDVVQAAADYYLLEAMRAGLVGTTDGKGHVILDGINVSTTWRLILDEANEMFDALVSKWDPILQAYTHMACGGELRHHVAVGGSVLNSDRDVAWSGWKLIYDAVGPDALEDAAALFMEFTGGSFGGEPWADACRILHARVTGQIKPALFLDRIFNAQHNGGVLLNKVNWKGEAQRYVTGKYDWTIGELQSRLLPAHGEEPEPDYSTLLAYASSQVRQLFDDCFTFAGHAAKEYGRSLNGRRTKPGVGDTQKTQYERRQKKLAAEQAAYHALPKSEKLKKDKAKYESYVVSYTPYAEAEAKENARIDAKVAKGLYPKCGCGVDTCYQPYKQEYYSSTINSYKESIAQLEVSIAKWEAYEAGVGPKPGSTGLSSLMNANMW